MKFLPFIFIALLFQGCTYYNYATQNTGKTAYKVRVSGQETAKWQFYSALYDEDGLYVELSHLRRHHHREGLNDYHQIYVDTRKSKECRANIILDSIVVSVTDINGNIIEQIEEPSFAGRGAAVFFYPLQLEEQLIENIEFKIKHGDEIKVMKYTFEVHKKLNYTSWSALQSV
jgi:hypothetical protein